MALSYAAHAHHAVAADWFADLQDGTRFSFCRHTQLGLLRLLTTGAVMGDDVLTQPEAWAVYDRWLRDERVGFADEPAGLERRFRARSRAPRASPQAWADAYLSAFADEHGLTLVTFDRGFRGTVSSLLLLADA
ncbi:MAG: TA system VapC family ribonuclease toxin [Vicinamibacterales bacterium]